MLIDVNQTISEKKNEFEILYENKSIYTATLPFIDIIGIFNLENLRKIKVYDKNNNLKYKTEYNYVDNQLEEFIPFKYLITNSQKFYQLKFINQNDNEDDVSIFFEMKEVWNGYYVIKYKDVIYKCFSIEDGYIRHICIYKDEIQISELLKPNVVIDGKDEYRIYLMDKYNYLSDSLSLFALYLDRTNYNSSYLKNNSKNVSKKFSYSNVNKYYNPNWVKNNFNAEDYFNKINQEVNKTKNEIMKRFKTLMIMMGLGFGICIIITILLLIILL